MQHLMFFSLTGVILSVPWGDDHRMHQLYNGIGETYHDGQGRGSNPSLAHHYFSIPTNYLSMKASNHIQLFYTLL